MRNRLAALWQHLKHEHADPTRMAVAVFLGVFVGTLPIYGLHILICVGLALALRLNKLTIVLAAHISVPFVAPFLVAGGIVIGEWVRFGEVRRFDLGLARDFLGGVRIFAGEVPSLWLSCLIGDAILGAFLGLCFAGATWLALRRQAAST